MITIAFSPKFLRQSKLLPEELIDEINEKIELFKNPVNHKNLKVHKLKGRLLGSYSFSINYEFRIIFEYLDSKDNVILLAIGNHKVYEV